MMNAECNRSSEGGEATQTLASTVRKNVIDLLSLLANAQEQEDYPVPVEWVCQWFDDWYHPNVAVHAQAFSEAEQIVLKHFNDFFDTVLNQIGDIPPTPEEMHAMPAWRSLMCEAEKTCNQLREGGGPGHEC